MFTFSERHMNVYHGHLTVYHSIMKNVMWRHFDQSAKQLIVGHTKIHYVITDEQKFSLRGVQYQKICSHPGRNST